MPRAWSAGPVQVGERMGEARACLDAAVQLGGRLVVSRLVERSVRRRGGSGASTSERFYVANGPQVADQRLFG